MHKFLPFLVISTLSVTVFALIFGPKIQVEVKKLQFANSPATNELSSKSYIDRILLSDGNLEANPGPGIWFNKKVKVPNSYLASLLAGSAGWNHVLGDSSSEKWIEIDLSTQKLFAHEGDRVVYTFPVSTGLPWMPTVTGEFRIWAKIASQRMTGGSVADGTFYDLPNVVFVQYFYKGYGMHGAYWHNDFGKPRSHGCVNMRNEDAQTLFNWTNPQMPADVRFLSNIAPDQSTRVVVHGTTPSNIN